MVFDKYMTMSKIIFNTLGNGVRDRTSRTTLPGHKKSVFRQTVDGNCATEGK